MYRYRIILFTKEKLKSIRIEDNCTTGILYHMGKYCCGCCSKFEFKTIFHCRCHLINMIFYIVSIIKFIMAFYQERCRRYSYIFLPSGWWLVYYYSSQGHTKRGLSGDSVPWIFYIFYHAMLEEPVLGMACVCMCMHIFSSWQISFFMFR